MLLDAVPTEEQTLGRMGSREQGLRYLTQHFQDLQGLKLLPFVALGLFLYLLAGSRPLDILVGFGLVAVSALVAARAHR
jgi:hypothetical protein